MAGTLPVPRESFKRIDRAKVAIVGSMWHPHCVEGMIACAQGELLRVGVSASDITVHRVPGSLELPFACRVLFERCPELDAVIAFGVILKGSTSHNDSVLQQVVHGFGLVTDRFGKPIINEVIGVTDLKDAEARSGQDDMNKGIEAVFALSELLAWLRDQKSAE